MLGSENALQKFSNAELDEKERLARRAIASIRTDLKNMSPLDEDCRAKKHRILELEAEMSAIRSERARRR